MTYSVALKYLFLSLSKIPNISWISSLLFPSFISLAIKVKKSGNSVVLLTSASTLLILSCSLVSVEFWSSYLITVSSFSVLVTPPCLWNSEKASLNFAFCSSIRYHSNKGIKSRGSKNGYISARTVKAGIHHCNCCPIVSTVFPPPQNMADNTVNSVHYRTN